MRDLKGKPRGGRAWAPGPMGKPAAAKPPASAAVDGDEEVFLGLSRSSGGGRQAVQPEGLRGRRLQVRQGGPAPPQRRPRRRGGAPPDLRRAVLHADGPRRAPPRHPRVQPRAGGGAQVQQGAAAAGRLLPGAGPAGPGLGGRPDRACLGAG